MVHLPCSGIANTDAAIDTNSKTTVAILYDNTELQARS